MSLDRRSPDITARAKLTKTSLQARFAALTQDLAQLRHSLNAGAAQFLAGLRPTYLQSSLETAATRIHELYARRILMMANVDLGGQYKKIMRFFWDPEPENDDQATAPIWCLGQVYPNTDGGSTSYCSSTKAAQADQVSLREDEADRDTVLITRPTQRAPLNNSHASIDLTVPPAAVDRGWPVPFLDDFESRFWFTYRSQFPTIKKSSDPNAASSLSLGVRLRSQLVDQNGFTADTGWGCMIRSGQCVLANALAVTKLGRDWRRGAQTLEERRLLSLFADDPRAPYSLHRFVQHGEDACGKYPGEWFGPSATARCIEALVAKHEPSNIKVYVTGDGANVYEDRLLSLAYSGGSKFCPVLLLVGTRLGIDRINPVYWDTLREVLQLPQSLGIAGGRPSASHYFVGVQGDHFFYLDPHQTRPQFPYYEDLAKYTAEDIDSCHTRRLRRLHFEAMDPSMLIAFLVKTQEDWSQWKKAISNISGKSVLHLAEREPPAGGQGSERAEAINEVEILDEDEPFDSADKPEETA